MPTKKRLSIKYHISALLYGLLLAACTQQQQPVAAALAPPPAPARPFTLKDFYSRNDILARQTDSLYNSMGLGARAAQLIMPATGVSKKYGLTFPAIIKLYKQQKIGGLLFLKGTTQLFASEAAQLNALGDSTGLPPLVYSCDCEPALFHKKMTDAAPMPAADQLKNAGEAAQLSERIVIEMKKMGIHWNFAPVVDINTNKDIINERSFGNDPKDVVAKAVAFVKTATDSNIATTLKHFPGHGAITGDTHKELLYIDNVLSEVNNFQSTIYQANPPSVMTGHIAVKKNDVYQTKGLPASLSPQIVRYLLKDNLGFTGIVVTDAMNMGAVQQIPDADYLALQAGNDVVLMPQHIERLHQQIMQSLQGGKALSKQLEASIKKILRLKICLGIIH